MTTPDENGKTQARSDQPSGTSDADLRDEVICPHTGESACCGEYYRCHIRCYETQQRGCVCGRGELHPNHDHERQATGEDWCEFTERHEHSKEEADQSATSTASTGRVAEPESGASAQPPTAERSKDSGSPLSQHAPQFTPGSAPALYAALKDLLVDYEQLLGLIDPESQPPQLLAARAALQHATGAQIESDNK